MISHLIGPCGRTGETNSQENEIRSVFKPRQLQQPSNLGTLETRLEVMTHEMIKRISQELHGLIFSNFSDKKKYSNTNMQMPQKGRFMRWILPRQLNEANIKSSNNL